MSTVQERVARGAAWLDETRPGWRDQINLDKLTLLSNFHCVLGQVFDGEKPHPDGCFAAQTAGFYPGIEALGHRPIEALGFNADTSLASGQEDDTRALEAEWRRVIHQGRVPAAELEPALGLA